MENFIPISRELLFSSLWRSLADKEAKILIDLMARAPYQPSTYNLYGVDIELQKYELCFSCVKMAEKYDISESFLKRYLNKLVEHRIIVKQKRKLVSALCSNKRLDKRPDKRPDKRTGKCTDSKLHFVTSIFFCGWVFGENTDKPSRDKIDLSNELSNELHNIEGIYIDNTKKEKEKKQTTCACARADFSSSPSGNDKIWYPVDQIANLEFPNAEDILETWREFSGQTNIQIKPLLHKYCNEQKMININQMTLDVFDFRFRKYMNRAFKTKSKKVEPVRVPNYIRFDD